MNKSNEVEQIKKLAKCISEIPNGTLKDIADKAGISKATLYRNYGTREGMVESIKQRAFEALEEINQIIGKEYGDFGEAVTVIVRAHMDVYEFFSYLCAFQETWEWECWEKYCQVLDKFFLHWQEKGAVKLKFSAQFLTEMFFTSICGLFTGMTSGRIAAKGTEDVFRDFFLNGIQG